jgi:hypothetical protein
MKLYYVKATWQDWDMSAFVSARNVDQAKDLWRADYLERDGASTPEDADYYALEVYLVPAMSDVPKVH